MKSYSASNIRYLRAKKDLTQQQFAELLGIKRSLVGAYEEGRAKPNLEVMERLSRIYSVSFDDLLRSDLSKKKSPKASGSFKVLAVTVDKDEKENIEFVPVKAAAGYLAGHTDPEFVAELPKFNLPNLAEGSYRAFEISGDSMIPIQPGSIIIGQYVEALSDVKDGHLYVVISQREGVVFKRLFMSGADMLICRSDNPAYPPYELPAEDVLEIWKAKAYVSSVFPEENVSLQTVLESVTDLKQELTRMKG